MNISIKKLNINQLFIYVLKNNINRKYKIILSGYL